MDRWLRWSSHIYLRCKISRESLLFFKWIDHNRVSSFLLFILIWSAMNGESFSKCVIRSMSWTACFFLNISLDTEERIFETLVSTFLAICFIYPFPIHFPSREVLIRKQWLVHSDTRIYYLHPISPKVKDIRPYIEKFRKYEITLHSMREFYFSSYWHGFEPLWTGKKGSR